MTGKRDTVEDRIKSFEKRLEWNQEHPKRASLELADTWKYHSPAPNWYQFNKDQLDPKTNREKTAPKIHGNYLQ